MVLFKRLTTLVLAMGIALGGSSSPVESAANWRSLVLKGNLKAQAKDWPQAQRYFQDALIRAPRENASRASILNSLAGVYVELGQYDKALGAYQEALSLYSATLGERSPVVGKVQTNLGQCYLRQGNQAEAQRYLKSAIALFEEQTPPAVFEKLLALDLLAESYLAKQQSADAKAVQIQQYQLVQTMLGVLPPIAAVLNYPPETPEKKQQLEAVEERMRKLHRHAVATRALSPVQLNRLVNDIADMTLRRQAYAKAEQAYLLMLTELKRDLGEYAPEIARVLLRLGLTKHGQQAYPQAVTFYERAYLIADRMAPQETGFLLDLLTQLAQAQQAAAQSVEADKTYQMALPLADKAKPSFSTARLYQEAVVFYQRTKQNAKAKPLLPKARAQSSLITIR